MDELLKDSVIQSDLFDERMFHDILDLESPTAEKIREEENSESSSKLFDLFGSFYKANPSIVPSMADTDQAKYLREMMETNEYKNLRNITLLDEFSAAIASFKFYNGIEEQEEKDSGDCMGLPNKYINAVNKPKSAMNSEAEKRYEMRQLLKRVTDETEGDLQAIRAAGCGPDPLGKTNMSGAMEVMKEFQHSNRLKDIAEMAGKMLIIAKKAQKEKINRKSGGIVDIEIGSDISRCLPSELIKLFDDDLEILFYRNLVENSLMQYKQESDEILGRGPIIVALDSSGSMSEFNKHLWAKAVCLALYRIAKDQKRIFAIIPFDSQPSDTMFFDTDRTKIIEEMKQIADIQCGGSTNFFDTLQQAFSVIESKNNRNQFKPSDIIMITDGECPIKSEQEKTLKSRKSRTQTNIFSISIMAGTTRELNKFSNQVFDVSELTENTNGLKEIFSI